MPLVNLCFRRLYDALGVGTPAMGEIVQKVSLATGKTVTVYLGTSPPLGIMSLESDQYGIPNRSSTIMRVKNEYESARFLEVIVSVSHAIALEKLELLRAKNQETQKKLLEEGRKYLDPLEKLLDVISGVLGLRIHRQLVLKPLVESLSLTGDFESESSFVGPAVEMLEGLELNSNTRRHLQQFLERIKDTPEDVLCKGGSIMHWLLRAWRERDAISKFMYLFIPLAAILHSRPELATESKVELESLEAVVRGSDACEKESLLRFIERAKTKFGPTLVSRFEDFARSAAISGWELHVRAFKKYNRMRNLLLHTGNRNVLNHINIEENTRTLEDLVERYVAIALLGSPDVYQSRWRPQRVAVAN